MILYQLFSMICLDNHFYVDSRMAKVGNTSSHKLLRLSISTFLIIL